MTPIQLGKYILVRRIATGGMGEVYYGKMAGAAGFQREVAIKKMLPHLSADTTFIDMLIKEAKLTVLLNHPNIVQVYDLAKEEGEYYIAMEYVHGVTVASILKQGVKDKFMLPLDVVLHVILQVLRGLSHAHHLRTSMGQQLEVLHRDITPQNILVTPDGWAKLTDFGIAKARNEVSTTAPGMLRGKIGYFAPEQLNGQPVDQRLDLFCVGIVFWEMLTNARLFKGVDQPDTIRMIMAADVPKLAAYRSDVPEAVENVLRRVLKPMPQDRYRSAQQFYDALAEAIAPRTADDVQKSAVAYLSSHEELFSGLISSDARSEEVSQPTQERTQALDENAQGFPTRRPAPAATSFTHAHQPNKAARALITLSVLIAVLAAGWGGWVLSRGQPAEPDQDSPPVAAAPNPDPPANVVKPRPKKPTGTAPTSRPKKRLTEAEIQAAVRKNATALVRCFNEVERALVPNRVDATLHIKTSGRVKSVAFKQPIEVPSARTCLEQALRRIRFRAQPLEGFEVNIPLTFKK